MNIRFDLLIVAGAVIVTMVLFIFLFDSIFSSNYNEKYHKFDEEFENIALSYKTKNFDEVLAQCDLILIKCEQGSNDIRARTFKGRAYLEMNLESNAIKILNDLIDKYPGIRMVYGDLVKKSPNTKSLHQAFHHIQTKFLEGYEEAINKPPSLVDIIKSMGKVRLSFMIFILTSTLAIYEKYRNKRKA